jgi:hypothetical protein
MEERCRCSYTDDHMLLKGGYLCNWTFCDVVTIVATFLNTLLINGNTCQLIVG